jgi:hypothetical protein
MITGHGPEVLLNGAADRKAHEQREAAGGDENAIPKRITMGALLEAHPRLRPVVIDGLLREGETLNIISAPKIGKSWLGTEMAYSVATGRDWLGRFTTTKGRVLILDNELHPQTLAHRLRTVATATELSEADLSNQIELVLLRGKLQNIAKLGALFSLIRPSEFSLVILDAFYRALPEGTDENSNAQMANIYNLIDGYADQLQTSFVLVHHSSKGSQSGKNVTDVGSGAGSMSRAADSHLILRQHEESDAVVLEAVTRSFAPVEPLCLRWDFPLFTVARDLDPSKLKQPNAKSNPDDDDTSLLIALDSIDPRRRGATVKALQGVLRWGRERVVRTLDRLLKEEILERIPVEVIIGNGAKTTYPGYRRMRPE